MGVLRAVFPHAGRIVPDIARVDPFSPEGRGEQLDDSRSFIRQPLPRGVHRPGAARLVQTGQHGPGLGDGVDGAFRAARAAQWRAVVHERPQIPASVPAFGFDGRAHPPGKTSQPNAVSFFLNHPRIALRAHGQEFAQPDALAAPVCPDSVHAVVPVPRAHPRKPALSDRRSPSERPHTVFMQAARHRAGPHLAVEILRAFRDGRVLQIGNLLPQDARVPGMAHVGRRREGQEQQIVGNAGAHAGERFVPPMQHIPGLKLPRGAAQDMLPRPVRIEMQRRKHVLQLIAEAVSAAGLTEPGPPADSGGQDLVRQPQIHHGVQRLVRRLRPRPAQAGERGHIPAFKEFLRLPPGVLHVLSPADEQRRANRPSGFQPQRDLQRPACPARRSHALGTHDRPPAQERGAARAGRRADVPGGEKAHARHRARGEADVVFRPHPQPAAVLPVGPHQPVDKGDQFIIPLREVSVLQRHVHAHAVVQ